LFPQPKKRENGCYRANNITKVVWRFPERPQDGHTIIFSLTSVLTANETFGPKQNAVLPQHSQARHNAVVVCYAFLYFIQYS